MTQEAYISALQTYFPQQIPALPDNSEPASIEDCLRYHCRVRRDKEVLCLKCASVQLHLEQFISTLPSFLLFYIPPGLQLSINEEFHWQNRRFSLRIAVNAHCSVLQWPQWRAGLLNPHCLLFQEVS